MNLVLPALEKTFGWAPPDVVTKISIIRIIGIPIGFIVATLFIKVGIKKITVPSLILSGVTFIAMANVKTLNQYVIVSIIGGIVGTAGMLCQGAFVANWFVRNRGKVLGIVTIAMPLSTATFTLIGTKIMEIYGYTAFYTGVGIIFIIVGVIGFKAAVDTPEELGFSPDGKAFTAEELAEIEAMKKHESAWSIARILKTKEMWAYAIAWAGVCIVMTGLLVQLVPVITSSGVPIDKALGMMSVAALLGMPLSYIWGWLDDKIGTPKTCTLFALSFIVGAVGMAYGSPEKVGFYYLAIICIALGTAGMPNLQPSLLAYMVGRKDFMTVFRYMNVLFALFTSIAMSYVPVMYGKFGSYKPVFLSLIPLSIMSGILFLFTNKSVDPERLEIQKEGKIIEIQKEEKVIGV
jgi:sugar phosphate permease